MAISFGKNEGFLLREEFVCKALPAADASVGLKRFEDPGSERPAKTRFWKVDEALLGTKMDEIPATAARLEVREQFIDTLMLRNANEIVGSLVGQPVTFLFHSHDYWGELDLCFVASDGTAVLIENKSGRASKASRRKFRDDVETITSALAANLEHRFTHVIRYLDRYHVLARRAFAACFLGIRCDVKPDSRDLWAEAASHLAIAPEELERRFQQGNQWLDGISASDTFATYLATRGIRSLRDEALPILAASSVTLADLTQWSNESSGNVGRKALAVEVQVFGTTDCAAQYIGVEPRGEFDL